MNDFPAGTKVRNRNTGAVLFVTEQGEWLERWYEKLPMSDMDHQTACGALELPAGACIDPAPHDPHLIRDAANQVATHYCDGAALPEEPCHRTREHVPHDNYDGQMNSGHGEHLRATSRCPGVGNFAVVVTPPADPFAGLD